jgi:N utilization substance protein B
MTQPINDLNEMKPGQGEELPQKSVAYSPRTAARQAALQALYQWQMSEQPPSEIIKQFVMDGRLEKVDSALFNELLTQVAQQAGALDELYTQYLDRSASMINPVEKSILRMGVYELKNKPEIPYKVVLNESVELAKAFGAEESHKYINGVLDKVAKNLRALEFNA